MRPNRCSRTQYLFTQNLSLSTFRQSCIKLDDTEGESFCSLSQVLTAFYIHPSSLRPHPCSFTGVSSLPASRTDRIVRLSEAQALWRIRAERCLSCERSWQF